MAAWCVALSLATKRATAMQGQPRMGERIALGLHLADQQGRRAGLAASAAVWGASSEISDSGAPPGAVVSAMRVTDGDVRCPGCSTARAA